MQVLNKSLQPGFEKKNLFDGVVGDLKTKKSFFLLLCACLFFSGCSGTSNWESSWPTYKTVLEKNDSIALIGRGDVFTLMRAKWYSNRLQIPMDSIYPFFENFSDSLIVKTLSESFSNITILEKKYQQRFPEETQKLDERIFIEGHFPEQGKSITLENKNTPRYLLLIHEITLGTDLNKSSFFDYSQKQNEIDQKKAPINMSVIMSFTLWDNLAQVPLYSAISEQQRKIFPKTSLEDIADLLKLTIKEIPQKISSGVKK